MSDLKRFEHLKVQLEVIKSATNNFAENYRIGKGGFGKVYKGELSHFEGHTTVAVKCLDRAFGQGDREFWNEILMLSVYKHENIVPLLGFCDEGGEKILVYEYASRRGLDLYLNSNDLTWVRRLEICIGAARGLLYLHDPAETQHRVLHRDIKSSNILLDENWNAMIADFGLSKFCPADLQYSFLFSNPVGTFGYWDPLYTETGLLTKESDVYSFGVVLFEVLCGRLCTGNNDKSQSFTELVRKHYKENNLNGIIFDNIKDKINGSSLKAFSVIAYQCLKRDRHKRPLMYEILKTLESALEYQRNDVGSTSVPFKSKEKVRANTHAITPELRRVRISERLRKLQEVVPNMKQQKNTADMLDLAVDYINKLNKEAEGSNRKRKGAEVKIGRHDIAESSKKTSTRPATAAYQNIVSFGDDFAPIWIQEKEHVVKTKKNQDSDSVTRMKDADFVGVSVAGRTTMDLDPADSDVVATGAGCTQVEADLVFKNIQGFAINENLNQEVIS